jgi:hypothetical protein
MRPPRLVLLALFACFALSCGDDDDGGIAAPVGLEVQFMSPDLIQIGWADATGGAAEGFRIYRNGGTGFQEIDTTTETVYLDLTVSSGQTYTYYVVAYVGTAESGHSTHVTVPAADPAVTLLVPDGGEGWSVGATEDIEWDTNCPYFDAVIRLSVDGGSTFPHTIVPRWAPKGSPYAWKVGYDMDDALVISGNEPDCVIEIEHYDGGVPNDASDALFTIAP